MRRILITIMLMFSCALSAFAQEQSSGALPFVRNDRGGVTSALAGAGWSAVHGADFSGATFGNVAAVPFMPKKVSLGVTYSYWAPSTVREHIVQAGGAFRVGKHVALTAGFLRGMHPSVEVDGSAYKPYDMAVGGGIAFSIGEHFGIGANLKYVREQLLEDYYLSGVSADAFVQIHGRDYNVMAGVVSVGPKVASSLVDSRYALPSAARLAADYVFRPGTFTLQPTVDMEVSFAGKFAIAGGLQAGFKDLLWLRAGYRYAVAGCAVPSHLGLGAGLTWKGLRLSLTYLTANQEMGNSLTAGLGYAF